MRLFKKWVVPHGRTKKGYISFRVPDYENPVWENNKDGHVFKVNEVLNGIENDRKKHQEDMDILSRRINNAFHYIGDLRSEYKVHEARFHTPKKPAEKKKGKK